MTPSNGVCEKLRPRTASASCRLVRDMLLPIQIQYSTENDLITKTYLYNFDPLKPYFYIVKLGFTGVYTIFLISAQNHRLWVLVRTASLRQF